MGRAARPHRLRDAGLRRTFREDDFIERAVAWGASGASGPPDTSERVVEIPWVVRRLRSYEGPVLDVGTAFAPLVFQRVLRGLGLPELHTVDLVPATLPWAVSHVADVRDLPFPDGRFATVVCISTLEHIGLDNTQYGAGGSHIDEGGDVVALRELGRVTARDGRVLVTVPAGRDEAFPEQRQYSPERWRRIAAAAGLEIIDMTLLTHAYDRGWSPASESEVVARTYGEGAPYAAAVLCAALRPSPRDGVATGVEPVMASSADDSAPAAC